MLTPVAKTKTRGGLDVEWLTRRLYFNGHDVTKGYRDLACVPRAFQAAAEMVGIDISPPELRQICNAQRGYTRKAGMITAIYAKEFEEKYPLDCLVLYDKTDKYIDLDNVVARMAVHDIEVGVVCTFRPCRHAMAIQLTEDGLRIVDNEAFVRHIPQYRGGDIHCLIGLRRYDDEC